MPAPSVVAGGRASRSEAATRDGRDSSRSQAAAALWRLRQLAAKRRPRRRPRQPKSKRGRRCRRPRRRRSSRRSASPIRRGSLRRSAAPSGIHAGAPDQAGTASATAAGRARAQQGHEGEKEEEPRLSLATPERCSFGAMLDPTKRARLIDLLRELSFERRRVTLASGRESDFFIDCKQTILTAEGHALVGELMFQALDDLPTCDAVGGVELGGCPLASAVSLISFQKGRPLTGFYVRKARKDHGTAKLVEGDKSLEAGHSHRALGRRRDHRRLQPEGGRNAESRRCGGGGNYRTRRSLGRRRGHHSRGRSSAANPVDARRLHGVA